jgi:purine-binding chemotaxis protein CheW
LREKNLLSSYLLKTVADIGIIKFQLGGIHFCIYADQIVEILRYTGVRRIPKPLPYVIGLIELRKYIVVVVDLRKRLGLSPITLSKDTIMIVINISTGMIGVLVEVISDFKRIPESMVLPPIAIAGFPEQLLSGVVAEEEDILIIPDFNKIFSSYINLRLAPISPSEKIAFQYRFVPGSLTRTLEQNVLSHYYLDHAIVKKLPHSLCLPSVRVHKVTSFYSDFQPQKYPVERKEQRRVLLQHVRTGDEKYLSLSQQVSPQQKQSIQEGQAKGESQDSRPDMIDSLVPDPHAPVPNLLEHILHTIERPHRIPAPSLSSRLDTGRQIAKTLQVSPTRVTKYLTYYAQSSSTTRSDNEPEPARLASQPPQTLEERLRELLQRNYPAKGEEISPYLLRTLQSLHDDRYVLTRAHLETICAHYQVAPIKMAKFGSFFPEYAFVLETESIADKETAENTKQETKNGKRGTRDDKDSSPFLELRALSLEPSPTSVSEYIQYLAEKGKLSEVRYVQYVASYTRVPTCRLSKLRSYYRWNYEQTD